MSTDSIISAPEFADNGANPEQWTCVCKFEGAVEEEIRTRTLAAITVSAAFVHMHAANTDSLAFRAVGHMDEAVADATQTLLPIIGPIITNAVKDIKLTSHSDAERYLAEGKDVVGFSILKTVMANLDAAG